VGRRGAILCEVNGQDLLVARDVDEALQSLALPHGLQHVGICQDEPETLVTTCAHHNTTHHLAAAAAADVVFRGMKECLRTCAGARRVEYSDGREVLVPLEETRQHVFRLARKEVRIRNA